MTRRSWKTCLRFPFMVVESDKADAGQWLSVLAQLPMPIAAIYTSGGKSIHALVKIDAASKVEWDAKADEFKPALITFGADKRSLTAVRLTRLPFCQRLGTEDDEGRYVKFA